MCETGPGGERGTALHDDECDRTRSRASVRAYRSSLGRKGGVPFCRRFLDLCSDHRLIERRPIDIISRGTSCGEANIKPVPGRSNASSLTIRALTIQL